MSAIGLPSGADGPIARARRRAGLSQKDVAAALGTSLAVIDDLEAGRHDPDAFLPGLSRLTGVPAGALVPEPPVISAVPTAAPVAASQVAPAVRTAANNRNSLVLVAVVLLVTVRFFTEVVPVIPRAGNFVDIPIFLAAAIVAAGLPRARLGAWYLRVMPISGIFIALSLVSAIVNLGRVELAPVLVFLYGFLAPVALYAVTYRIWTPGRAATLSRTLVGLGFVQLLVVAAVNLPTFVSSHDPDVISGTFGTNAYQLVYFLLVVAVLLVGITTFEPGTWIARWSVPVLAAILAVMLLAQYRAFLVPTVVAAFAVAYLLRGRGRGVGMIALATVSFAVAFQLMATHLPFLKLESAATSITGSPTDYVTGRGEVFGNVFDMYGDLPETALIGSGPGTYSSRAWQTFAAADSESASNVAGGYATRFLGGVVYATDVSDTYVHPQQAEGTILQGSRAVSNPYLSYASLMAEVGVVGFALLVSLYLLVMARAWRMAKHVLRQRRVGDPLPALVVATAMAFLTILQMAFLENWLEVTRVTFVIWIMLAVCARELDEREQRA